MCNQTKCQSATKQDSADGTVTGSTRIAANNRHTASRNVATQNLDSVLFTLSCYKKKHSKRESRGVAQNFFFTVGTLIMRLPSDVLRLNVAGTIMYVRHSTLQFDPDSTLAKLPKYKDKFVDRPVDTFAWVLDWCRACGQRELPAADRAFIANIMHEADYWGLTDLKQQCSNHLSADRVSPVIQNDFIGRKRLKLFMDEHVLEQVQVAPIGTGFVALTT